jgi:uncharacterized membrane protein
MSYGVPSLYVISYVRILYSKIIALMYKKVVFTYLSVLLVLLLMDGIWLSLIAKDSYQQQIGYLMGQDMPTWPWLTFYLLYPAGILYLAILPSTKALQSSLRGFVLGLTAYGTYNLTNYSIIEHWPLAITLQDWLWGSVLTLICASCGMQTWLRIKHD